MKFKKIMALTLSTIMGMTFLVGCKGGSTETSGTEKKKLTVSVWDNDMSPMFTAVTEAFKAENPDVEIEFIDTQADEYDNKLTVMLSGGDSDPDVIFVKNAETQVTMQKKGQIMNLDEYIKKDNFDLSPYGGIGEMLKMDGSNYTLPYRKDWYTLYYNKDLFDAAGVAYPSEDMTWDEYEQLAKKMTSNKNGSNVFGSHNHTWMALVSNWAVQDGKNDLMADDYSFLKPYYEQALRMQKEGTIQSYANLKTSSIHYVSSFEQGQVAMVPMGSWFLTTLINDKEAGNFNFDWGVTRIPHPQGVEAGTTVGSVTPVAINSKTDNADLAWEYVKFVTGEKGAEILADNGLFPAYESESVTNKLAQIKGFPEDGKSALTTTGFVFDRPLHEKMASVRKVIEEEHDLIMIGQETVDKGIENMNKRAKEAKAN